MTALTRTLRVLARMYPVPSETSSRCDASESLRRALAFVDVEVAPETVVRAGYGGAVLGALLFAPAVALVPAAFVPAAALGVVTAALGIVHCIHRLPAVLASARRSLALGAAPGIVGRAVLRLRVEPTAESAAAFAARTGDGPLAESLGTHVRRAEGTPSAGLGEFAAEWEDWFPELGRAATLLDAAASAPAGERAAVLDRALATVLDGTRDQMAAFAANARGPATGVYAFGVLLPLALIAVLPAANVAGVPVSPPLLVVTYGVVLPAGVLVAAGWLLIQRPVAFPPPRVGRTHPDVPERRWPPVFAGVGASIFAGVGCWLTLPTWTLFPGVVGASAGVLLAAWYRPIVRIRDRARAVEAGLVDALSLVGREVGTGTAVEAAIERAGETLDGETGDVLADAARIQRQLRVGVRASFLGEHGALADVPSPRARSTAALLALAAREGRPAGRAVVAMAGHLEELHRVEQDARHQLARITGTLRSTATVFGPLVAGVTVALSERVGDLGQSADGSSTLPIEVLGIVVGTYVLLLAAILTALAIGLERGLDRPLVGYRVGGALVCAATVYLSAYAAAGLFV